MLAIERVQGRGKLTVLKREVERLYISVFPQHVVGEVGNNATGCDGDIVGCVESRATRYGQSA